MAWLVRTVLQRGVLLFPTLLLATFVVFLLAALIPGDAAIAILGERATAQRIAEVRAELGLDDPLVVQYWDWLSGAIRLDFGRSLFTQEEVMTAIRRTLPPTLSIVAGGLLFSVVVGVPAGIASARRADRRAGNWISGATSLGVAMPSFWLGLILVSVFSLRLGLLPATGFTRFGDDPIRALRHMVLPSVAIGVVGAAEVARQLRAVMIEILATDHVRTLRAKGLRPRTIVWRHGLRNAAVPLLTIVGLQVNRFLGATVVIEAVFGITGVGSLVVAATQRQDIPVVQGVVMVMVLVVVVTNLLVDVGYRLSDPRVR